MLIFTLCHYFLFSTNIMWSFINALRSCENVSERFFCRKCDDSRLTGGRIPFFPAVLSWTMCEEQLENKTEEEDDGVSSVHQVQSLVLDVWPSINISLFKMSFIFYWLTHTSRQREIPAAIGWWRGYDRWTVSFQFSLFQRTFCRKKIVSIQYIS